MSFEKILKYIVFTGIFLIPFVPLYVAGIINPSLSLFFPFITGKAFLFRIITEIIFSAWVILALKNSNYRPEKSWLLYAITAFVGVIALADIISGHFLKSFWSNFERMEGLVTLLHLLAYFYVLVSFIKTEKIWDRLIQTSTGVSLIIGSWGFFQFFGKFVSIQSGTRLDASFGNASYLAIYMLFHVFLLSYLLFKHQGEKWVKWLYGVIIAFQTFILIFTATRGAILGLVGGVFLTFLLIALFDRENRSARRFSIGAIVSIFILVGLFFAFKNTSVVQNVEPLQRLSSINLEDRTTISRFVLWGMALDAFKEKPILGWGQENFIFVFEKYYDPKMYAQEPWFDRAHNVIFDWLIAGGIFGLLFYLSLFFFALRYTWKSQNLSVVSKSLFTGLLAAYFFHNLFVFDNIASYLLFIFVLALIHFQLRGEKELQPKPSSFVYTTAFVPIIIVLMVFSVYFFNAKLYLTSRSLLYAIAPQPGGLAKNLEFFKRALAYDTSGTQEVREHLLTSTSNIVVNSGVPQELKEEFIILSKEEQQKQIDSNPTSVRHQIFLGSLLSTLQLYDEAIVYLEEGLRLSPQKQTTHLALVSVYLNSGQTQKAVNIAKTAYELDERFNTARIIYATTLIYNKQEDLAESLLNEKFDENFGDKRIAIAYFRIGDFTKSINQWGNVIKQHPDNIQFRAALVGTLLGAGLREESIIELQKAAEVDPSFKEQADSLIQKIRAGEDL
ncbi:MAG TPA: O-antigen ligase family protein [Candidatus Paceibacterota bacterium]|nr:O-antigen ligase family protein [Candidatus Paceibacterota bacterium]